MLRSLTNIMASGPKRVSIPKNGVDYRGKIVLAPMVNTSLVTISSLDTWLKIYSFAQKRDADR